MSPYTRDRHQPERFLQELVGEQTIREKQKKGRKALKAAIRSAQTRQGSLL